MRVPHIIGSDNKQRVHLAAVRLSIFICMTLSAQIKADTNFSSSCKNITQGESVFLVIKISSSTLNA